MVLNFDFMNINFLIKILILLSCLRSVTARRRRGGFFNFFRRIHIDGKSIGRALLKGLHVVEKIAASGALGPGFKAAAVAAQTAETVIRGIIQHKSAKQIAEEAAMTAAGALVGGGMKEKLLRMVAQKIGIKLPPQTGSDDTNFSSKLMDRVKNKLAQHGINDPTAHIKEMMTEHIKDNMHEFMPSHAIDHHDEDQHNYGQNHEHVYSKTNLTTENHNNDQTHNSINTAIDIATSHSSISNIDSSHSPSSTKNIESDFDAPNLMKAPLNDYFPFQTPCVYDQQNSPSQYYKNPYMDNQYPDENFYD